MRNTTSIKTTSTGKGPIARGASGQRDLKGEAMDLFNGFKGRGWRAGMAVVLLSALAACDPAPVGDTSCVSAVGCEIVALTVKDLRGDIGENYGGGVVLRNARALGQTLVVDVTLPLSATAFKEPVGQQMIKTVGPAFAGGFCEGEYARDFFALGNKVRVRGFSTDSQLVADRVIISCGGARQ